MRSKRKCARRNGCDERLSASGSCHQTQIRCFLSMRRPCCSRQSAELRSPKHQVGLIKRQRWKNSRPYAGRSNLLVCCLSLVVTPLQPGLIVQPPSGHRPIAPAADVYTMKETGLAISSSTIPARECARVFLAPSQTLHPTATRRLIVRRGDMFLPSRCLQCL